MKTCTKCDETKPLEEFHRHAQTGDGYRNQCKVCAAVYARKYRAEHKKELAAYHHKHYATHKERADAYQRKYNAEHRKEVNARNRKWRAENPERAVSISLKHRFDITLADYDAMLIAQDGVCAICGKTPWEEEKRLAVDHNHETGRVRGLLCNNCNSGIGYLQDNPGLCRLAADYLDTLNKEAENAKI